jgi:ribosomal protein S18 acetylase RimI-like enzyme
VCFDITLFDKYKHERQGFDCGDSALNHYLIERASQDIQNNYVRLVVATKQGNNKICGYYTLSNAGVRLEDIPEHLHKKLPKYPSVPAILLGRLAIDKAMQGQGLGSELMADAIFRSLNNFSAWAVMVVQAKDDKACAFYRKFQFLPLMDDPHHLYVRKVDIEHFVIQRLLSDISK